VHALAAVQGYKSMQVCLQTQQDLLQRVSSGKPTTALLSMWALLNGRLKRFMLSSSLVAAARFTSVCVAW
jgi:hypothetical protein